MQGWKTVTYAAGLILAVISVPQFQDLIAQNPTVAAVVNGIIVVALRWFTTTPIFNK